MLISLITWGLKEKEKEREQVERERNEEDSKDFEKIAC